MRWYVPKMWQDCTCYVIGGGPSAATFDFDRLWGQKVIAVNDAFHEVPWAQILFFMDRPWFEANIQALAKFPHIIATTKGEPFIHSSRVKYIKNAAYDYLPDDPGQTVYANNAGLGATILATKLGVSRIILVGFDMKKVEGRNNYHDRNIKSDVRGSLYNNFYRAWEYRAEQIREKAEVINACPESRLDFFPRVSHEEVYP